MNLNSPSGLWTFMLQYSAFVALLIPVLIYRTVQNEKFKRRLKGKVVFITGASQGLGEELAHVFYKESCKIILAARNKENLLRVKNDLLKLKLTKRTFEPAVVVLDLANLSEIAAKAKEAIDAFGDIDILINNGGISFRGQIIDTDIDVHQKVMLINYFGGVELTKAVLGTMCKKRSGQIVGISSAQGKIGIPHRAAYAASKHACQAYYDVLRSELYDKNIKVTVISPGYIKTSLSINAVKADGSNYGVMDASTSKGLDPKVVAEKILQAVIREEKEVIIAPFSIRFAMLMRWLFPILYFWVMARRARKE